jgi:hypothetical protein
VYGLAGRVHGKDRHRTASHVMDMPQLREGTATGVLALLHNVALWHTRKARSL